ncbi:MAG: rod shape-determining protein RodA [Candidatus Margulisbacteria bacterium]|jgi:rod shape determining protein RodA|nr:rod shape-determining protein RodA [Candidatus Margulisiibacteriota bacterium]
MINFRMLKLSDLFLWAAVGALLAIGLAAIFSSTYQLQLKAGGDPFLFVTKQSLALLLGLVGLGLFCYLDYQRLRAAAPYLYLLVIFLLVAILFTGAGVSGAQRWFQLGFFSFQPSEIAKLVLIIALAAFLTRERGIRSVWAVGLLLGLVGLPFLLIFKQPDLGTALVFFAILLGMLAAAETAPLLQILLITPVISLLLRPIFPLWLIYLAAVALALFLTQARWFHWLTVLGSNVGVGIALPFLWGMLKSYQRQRIVAFLNPGADPLGAGYHTLQSKIAIGGGGFLGKGFLQGSQTQLQFIPEQFSDFIFSVVGEEFGLLGALLVLSLFGLIVWRGLVIAAGARDSFGRLLAYGIVTMLVFHFGANVGMALGVLPVVGIPLPFLSYGGSSLVMNLAGLGILQSIAMRRQKLIF